MGRGSWPERVALFHSGWEMLEEQGATEAALKIGLEFPEGSPRLWDVQLQDLDQVIEFCSG